MAVRRYSVGLCLIAFLIAGNGYFAWRYFAAGSGNLGDLPADAPSGIDIDNDLQTTRTAVLDKTQRKLLWEIEHQGLVLGDSGFKAISTALATADAPALTRLMAVDFRGQAPGAAGELRRETTFVSAVRRRAGSAPLEELNRDSFAARLLEMRAVFAAPPKVKVSLKELAPVDRNKLEGDWRGSGVLRMWGTESPGQPAEVVIQFEFLIGHPESTIAPPDDSQASLAALDGWWRAATIRGSLVTRAPRFLLRDATRERGLNPDIFWDNWKADAEGLKSMATTGGAYLTDYNRDAWVDMLVADTNGIKMYGGRPGGKFHDVSEEVGLEAFNGADWKDRRRDTAIFFDIDGDGWDDLVLGEIVLENDEGRRYVLRDDATLRIPGPVVGAAVADYDRDGRLDVYLVQAGGGKADSWIEGKSGNAEPNLLMHNEGNWQFRDVTDQANAGGGFRSSFSAAWLDADNDRWPDLYVINEFGEGVLLLSDGKGKFRERLLSNRPSDYGSMGLAAGDINNDGLIDLFVANMYSKAGTRVIGNLLDGSYPQPVMDRLRTLPAGSQLYVNRGEGNFDGVGRDWQIHDVGWSYGPSLVDLNNDGWLDLHATCGFISRDRSKPDG